MVELQNNNYSFDMNLEELTKNSETGTKLSNARKKIIRQANNDMFDYETSKRQSEVAELMDQVVGAEISYRR